ncbi:MAG: hypothetical protein KHX07_00975 [Peptostreptococcus sp.]|nr:hypothetical protein [Peptostreptococcus sp.]
MRTYYYMFKYARVMPSNVYAIKKNNPGEYLMLKSFLIKEIEDKIEERKYMICPLMAGGD